MSPIYIGFSDEEKHRVIREYCLANDISSIYVFYPDKFPLDVEGVNVVKIRYADIIMYKTFYHLLEVINGASLLVFNECMRTQNRNDLTYNCAHHYCNQTSHKLVFEYLPFIEQPEDFMILLNFLDKGKYKGKSFDFSLLSKEKNQIKPIHFTLQTIAAYISPSEAKGYVAKKMELFKNLGKADPDTIPRQLHVFAGNFKKKAINPTERYVARNKRFGLDNITVYCDAQANQDYIIVDFPHRRIDFNDFLKHTRMKNIRFLNTGLKVDLYYYDELKRWIDRLEEFYAKASIC